MAKHNVSKWKNRKRNSHELKVSLQYKHWIQLQSVHQFRVGCWQCHTEQVRQKGHHFRLIYKGDGFEPRPPTVTFPNQALVVSSAMPGKYQCNTTNRLTNASFQILSTWYPSYNPILRRYALWVRVQLRSDGTRWRTGGEVKWKLSNAVGIQYSSHYLGTWCI